jgi:hypothetical protein
VPQSVPQTPQTSSSARGAGTEGDEEDVFGTPRRLRRDFEELNGRKLRSPAVQR